MTEGWEDRMAARAAARRHQQQQVEAEVRRLELEAWHAEHDSTVEAYVEQLAAQITEDDLRDFVPYACACVGAPSVLPSGSPCCCALSAIARTRAAERLGATDA